MHVMYIDSPYRIIREINALFIRLRIGFDVE